MAVYCEIGAVITYLHTKTQSFYEALKRDAIAEQLYSPEGDSEAYFSRSLDKEPPMFNSMPTPAAGGATKDTGTLSPKKNNTKQIKSVQFEKCTDVAYMYQFTKEEIKKPTNDNKDNKDNKDNRDNKDNKDTENKDNKETKETKDKDNNKENNKPISNLTRSIKPNSESERRGEEEDIMVPPDKPGMMLTIHTWSTQATAGNNNQQSPLSVKVIEKASVGQIIYVVLKLMQKKDQSLNMDLKHYLLRIADANGTADEDYPALDEKQLIYKFRDEHFVLCRNPKAKDLVRVIPPQERSTVIKVNFPDHSSTKIIVKDDLTIGELLKIVSRKRQYNEKQHYMRLPYSEAPCDLNMTMEKLGVNELTLSHKSMLQEEDSPTIIQPKRIDDKKDSKVTHRKSFLATYAPPPIPQVVEEEDEKAIIWPDALYKSYEVVKIKNLRYGKKETLGIDRDRIAHMSQQKRDSSKSKTRMIRDVVKVALLDRPKQFTLDYADGKAYVYESQAAREIVAKIKYLVNTENSVNT